MPIATIAVGERDREDLGDIAALAESVRAVGLLHPVVVTESLTLVAGGRRLEAVRQLGWTDVAVTVVNLENVAAVLRAEADENTQRKPLTPYEASRMRERRTRVLAEDAERRKAATRAKPGEQVGSHSAVGSANLAEPTAKSSSRETRKAGAIGSGYSGTTLDKVDSIRDAAERGMTTIGKGKQRREVPVPEPVQTIAQQGLENVKKTGAAVDRAHRDVQSAIEKHLPPDPDRPHRKWRINFMAALVAGGKPMQFTPEDIAERADAVCLDELRRLVEEMNEFHDEVVSLVAESLPDNVRTLRKSRAV